MNELEKFQKVNACETFDEFKETLKSFADEEGMIQGRTRKFTLHGMLVGAENYYKSIGSPNQVTREYGLRQQLMYIKYYEN